jgi:hypothetical protein
MGQSRFHLMYDYRVNQDLNFEVREFLHQPSRITSKFALRQNFHNRSVLNSLQIEPSKDGS